MNVLQQESLKQVDFCTYSHLTTNITETAEDRNAQSTTETNTDANLNPNFCYRKSLVLR